MTTADLTGNYKQFTKVASQTLQSLASDVIVKVKNDYIVFKSYKISQKDNDYTVTRDGKHVHEFTTSRNALAYCILEHNHNREEARVLLHHDRKLQNLEYEITQQSHIMNTTKDKDRRSLMAMKVTNNIAIRGDVKIKVNDQISLAKYYQQKGFDNETARTRKK